MITIEVQATMLDMTHKVINNNRNRLNQCLNDGCSNLIDKLLFKTQLMRKVLLNDFVCVLRYYKI